MTPDLIIAITDQKIILKFPELGRSDEFANQVSYDRSKLALRTVGKKEAEVKILLKSEWPVLQKKLVFTRIFDPNAHGPIFDYQAVEFLFQHARQVLFANPISQKIPALGRNLAIEMQIENYERLSLGRQRELEYYLQDFQGVNSLIINAQDRTIAPGKKLAQAVFSLILRVLAPALVLYGSLLGLTRIWSQEIWMFLAALLLGILSAGLTYIVGTILWLILFRSRLPHGYLRYQLRSGPKFLRNLSRWLAAKLLE